MQEQVEKAKLPNGLVPLRFTAGYGMTAYNAGVVPIYFDESSPFMEVPVPNAVTLLERYPRQFRIQAREDVAPVSAEEGEESTEDMAEASVTRSDLETLTVARLRRIAAQEANEGETVPRLKNEIIDFILDHSEE